MSHPTPDHAERAATRFLQHVALLLLTLTVNGCLVADTTLTLKTDGSGSIAITYSIDEDVGTQLKGILSLRQSVAQTADPRFKPSPVDRWIDILDTPTESHLEDDLAPYRADGLLLESARITANEGQRETRIKLVFTNVQDLARLDIFPALGLSLRRASDGNFTMRRAGQPIPSTLTDSLRNPAYMADIQPVLSGLVFNVGFVSPSPIVSTSGTKLDATRAQWVFSFDKNPGDLLSLQNQELSVTFEGKGLTLPEL